MASDLEHYQQILGELPVETQFGLNAGAVGKTTVQEMIAAGSWFEISEKDPNVSTIIDSYTDADGSFVEESERYNGWLVETAKGIRGNIDVNQRQLLIAVDEYLDGERGLQSLIKDYGVKEGTFTDVEGENLQEQSVKVRELVAARKTGAPATSLMRDILAYNLITSAGYADLVNVTADEAGPSLSQSWYSAGSVGVLNAAIGGAQGFYNDVIASEEQAEEYKQLLAARRDAILSGKSEKEVGDLSKEQQESNITFHLQALLAANMAKLATLSESQRSYNSEKYKKTWMLQSHPSEIVNKLTYVAGSEEFANITVPEASSLVPMIRLYKIIYNIEGEKEEILPIVFNSHTKTEDIQTSGLEGLGRSGVGIRSFDWQYNGTNIATTKNDITAKLVLYFQNFNDLLTLQPNGFKYVDLLIRTSPGETKDSDNSIEDPCVPNSSSPKINIADPRHFEIKAVVGWAPNLDYAKSVDKDKLAVGIQGQVVPLFLTLVEHEFNIQQDGTFELSIDYRGRIDGIMMDKRADIILTPETRRELCVLQKKLTAAQEDCFPESIQKLKNEIKKAKQRAKNQSGTQFTLGLLEANKIYCLEVSKEEFDKARGELINITPDQIAGLASLKLLSEVELSDNRSAVDEVRNQTQFELDREDPNVNIGGCTDTWAEYIAGNAGDLAGTAIGQLSYIGSAVGVDLQGGNDYLEELAFGTSETSTENSDWVNCYLRQQQGGYEYWTGNNIEDDGDEIRDSYAPEDGSGGLGKFGVVSDLSEDDGRLIIPYFFFGDLVDLAANYALGPDKYSPSEDECDGDLSPNRVSNLGIILGTMHLEKFGDNEEKTINLGDIPIALAYFKDWWFRNVNKQSANTFPLIRFIRECLKDFVIDAVGGEVLDGRRPQRLLMKDASISVPAIAGGINPIDLRASLARWKPDMASSSPWDPNKLVASRVLGDSINNAAPLTPVNPPSLTPNEMFHFKVFYLVNESPTHLNGDRLEDNKRGIQHVVMGSNSGILKEAQFKRSTVKGLREQRVIEESEFNPLKHLADVYNITAKMIGNVIFYPGQLIYLNPIGFGSKLGLPSSPMSPSRAMGIGGYHLITQVSSYIENGKFETTVEALFETSGGRNAKRADNGRETEESKCDTSIVGTPQEDIKSDIDKPEGGGTE